MLINRIKDEYLKARLWNIPLTTKALCTLIAACEAVGKKSLRAPTDDECISVIKSFIKQANITKDAQIERGIRTSKIDLEISIYNSYLPTQLTVGEITDILEETKILNLGLAMKYFKEKYNGRYDSKELVEIVKKSVGGQR